MAVIVVVFARSRGIALGLGFVSRRDRSARGSTVASENLVMAICQL